MGTSRLETFADGVFAIAATLLVLHVSADARGAHLGAALRHAWPQYAAYVMSFLMIGTWWVNHHAYFQVINRVDRPFLFANLGFLTSVAFLPFPTNLVAEHFNDPGLRAATVTYGVVLTASAFFMKVMWSRAAKGRRLITPGVDQRVVDGHSRDIAFGAPTCLAATLLAFWSPYITLGLIAASEVFYVVGGTLFSRETRSSPALGDEEMGSTEG